ncbi:MAG TPA: trigger factor [Candidatus Saccharimonadales bacterium]|jgi:trigger factor
MKLSGQEISKTSAKYTIKADASELDKYLKLATKHLSSKVKVPGFRPGKAPSEMIAKHADQSELQDEFLNHAANDLYVRSVSEINQKIIGEPKINITKFVPYSALEISVQVPIVKDLKLPAYSALKQTKTKVSITTKMVEDNLSELQKRAASLSPVQRAAKNGDLVVLDFEAIDSKTKEKLPQASATDYRLALGDNAFIPGFEEKLVGLTPGKSKSFDITFPKDYFDKSFVSRKVTFKVTINEVNAVDLPKLDEEFAKKVGSFNSLDELKTELKRQLQAEADRRSTIDLENKILDNLAQKTEVEIDDSLVNSEYEMLLDNAQKAALNRGQTWQEFLASTGESEESYQKQLKKAAAVRIRGGLAIGEIANRQGLTITDTELDQQIEALKLQYPDPSMQTELSNPNNRQELRMRLLTEKVLDFIQNSK